MIRAFVNDLMHDHRGGLLGELARGPLWVASGVYGIGLSLWDAGYRSRIFRSHRLPCPVISVGNLTVGGTGKTPFVRYLGKLLLARWQKVAILSRGYARLGPGVSDEGLELEQSFPEASVTLGRDRVRSAREAFARHRPTVFILEDGFQHRRVARQLDICLIDATNPFGNGHLLPRGILRERPTALKRADLIVLTHLEGWPPTSDLMAFLWKTVPKTPILFARHRAKACHQIGGNPIPLDHLRKERLFAFSGIANPVSLDRTLRELGVVPALHQHFPDHHRYTRPQLSTLGRQARELKATMLVTTQKDVARIRHLGFKFERPLLALEIEMELFQNVEELTRRLDTLLHL